MNEIEILQEAALADFIKDPPIVADIKAAYIAGWLVYVLCVWVGELISDLFFH